jgi:hypothetical protein
MLEPEGAKTTEKPQRVCYKCGLPIKALYQLDLNGPRPFRPFHPTLLGCPGVPKISPIRKCRRHWS